MRSGNTIVRLAVLFTDCSRYTSNEGRCNNLTGATWEVTSRKLSPISVYRLSDLIHRRGEIAHAKLPSLTPNIELCDSLYCECNLVRTLEAWVNSFIQFVEFTVEFWRQGGSWSSKFILCLNWILINEKVYHFGERTIIYTCNFKF